MKEREEEKAGRKHSAKIALRPASQTSEFIVLYIQQDVYDFEKLEVLLLHRQADTRAVHQAVQRALNYGCYEAAAVLLILRQAEQVPEVEVAPLSDLGELERYNRPAGDTRAYDMLLRGAAVLQEVSR